MNTQEILNKLHVLKANSIKDKVLYTNSHILDNVTLKTVKTLLETINSKHKESILHQLTIYKRFKSADKKSEVLSLTKHELNTYYNNYIVEVQR